MIDIIEHDHGTIEATATHNGLLVEVGICAEYEPGCPETKPRYNRATANMVDPGEPAWPASCEITRVYIDVMDDYQIDIPLTAISRIVKEFECEIVATMEDHNP